MQKDYIKEVLVKHEEIVGFCKQLGQQIDEKYHGEPVVLLCVLKGSVPFLAELMKHIHSAKPIIEFIRASSYEGKTEESKGSVDLNCKTFDTLAEQSVIILEDILDTGRTLQVIKEYVESQQPKSLEIATLVDKPSRRVIEVNADYVGFTIPNHFVVGFGLDYDEKYRELEDIVIPYPEKL